MAAPQLSASGAMPLPHDLLPHERPRERLVRLGPASLRDAELLALALRTGTRGRTAIDMGSVLLQRYGGLRGLFGTSPEELMSQPGLGIAKACTLTAILELARRASEESLMRPHSLADPGRVRHYFRTALSHRDVEYCMALYLDNQLNLIASSELARGTLAQASIYPREVVREALRHHAAAMILAHNHPSGSAQPSQSDRDLTLRLKQALALVDVRLLDHVIVAGDATISMAELGML